MQFLHKDLGYRQRGEIVEVTLRGNAANVLLLDSSNFSSYKAGRRCSYRGGHVTRSPYRVSIPHAGHWHVAIDLGGYRGSVNAGVRVLPGALPAASDRSLADVPSLVRDVPPTTSDSKASFDVFISHASEDKDPVVRRLASELQQAGLEVWYDEYELKIGDSLRQKIDHGLARSRFGIVVLSRSFFAKGWTNYELDGIVTRSVTGDQVILPIWHEITKDELIDFSPSLADKVARSTTTHTIEEIAAEIADVVSSSMTAK
ncbi:MAG: DUF1883 domain-containing protein [Planctomycetota bacterium]